MNTLAKVAALTANARKHIKTKNFGIPSKAGTTAAKSESGNYPIHDAKHARLALSYGKRFLSPEVYAKLKKRIKLKYPEMGA